MNSLMWRSRWATLGICLMAGVADAQKPAPSGQSKTSKPNRNVTMKTLGGRQFWTDVQFFHDWRIQQHAATGHCRLLDGRDFRHAVGSLDSCRKRLEELKRERALPPMSGKAVVFVHGIFRSSKSFRTLRKRLQAEGYEVFGFDYASTQISIVRAAEYLHQVLESLKGTEEVNLVVHSMGGLVVRSYLSQHKQTRIHRMVMMAVPNLGAHMADLLKANPLYRVLFGPAGQQLVSDPEGFVAALPIPKCQFAVIAGARGTLSGYNPLIPGDDDGTVAVTSTRLPGAADFATVRCLHSFIMNHEDTVDMTARFLKTGLLREGGPPRPIRPRDDADR